MAQSWPENALANGLSPLVLKEYWSRWLACQQAKPESAGLLVQLFLDRDFKQSILTRPEPWVGWDWGYGAPHLQMPEDNYSLTISGFLTAPVAGDYKLRLFTSDETKVLLDNKPLLSGNSSVMVTLTGKPQSFSMTFREGSGTAFLYLYWTPSGGQESLIPPEAYSHETP